MTLNSGLWSRVCFTLIIKYFDFRKYNNFDIIFKHAIDCWTSTVKSETCFRDIYADGDVGGLLRPLRHFVADMQLNFAVTFCMYVYWEEKRTKSDWEEKRTRSFHKRSSMSFSRTFSSGSWTSSLMSESDMAAGCLVCRSGLTLEMEVWKIEWCNNFKLLQFKVFFWWGMENAQHDDASQIIFNLIRICQGDVIPKPRNWKKVKPNTEMDGGLYQFHSHMMRPLTRLGWSTAHNNRTPNAMTDTTINNRNEHLRRLGCGWFTDYRSD